MYKRLYHIVFLLMMMAVVNAQVVTYGDSLFGRLVNPPLCEGHDMIKFTAPDVDFDTLSVTDKPVVMRFSFANNHPSDVQLTRVESCCGCAVMGFSSEVGDVQGFVDVVFNPSGYTGAINRQVYVYSSLSGEMPTAVLSVKGFVKAADDVRSKGYRYNLGGGLWVRRNIVKISNIEAGALRSERVACINSGSHPFELPSLDLPGYAVVALEPAVIEPGGEGDIVVVIDGSKLPSIFEELSFVVFKGNPEEYQFLQVKVSSEKKNN